MREVISISASPEELETLDKTAAKEGVTRSRLVRKAIKGYIRTQQLEALRQQGIPLGRSMNVYSDEDVFNLVS